MSGVSTHVLDLTRGHGVAGLAVALERRDPSGEWTAIGQAQTDTAGRIGELAPAGALVRGVHRLVFDTGSYFDANGETTFFPEVAVIFHVLDPSDHHHVPVLLSPFGYSTYRGT